MFFCEEVRVASVLPSKLLIGSRFWHKHGLVLDLRRRHGQIWNGRCIRGKVSHKDPSDARVEIEGAIRDADVDDAIREMDFSQFSPSRDVQEKLLSILWTRRAVLKGLGRIEGFRHKIELVKGAKPVCCPVHRRSTGEEDTERRAMEKLLEMGVVAPTVSPWATCNVFVKKKDGSTRVTSHFRGLNTLTVADSYPVEYVKATLKWMGSKAIFSTFGLKDGYFQVELHEDAQALTIIRTVIGLLCYCRLPQGLRNAPAGF